MARILFDIGHPADVHMFRVVAQVLTAEGHAVWFTTLDRESVLHLLEYYGLPYSVTYRRRSGQRGKLALARELGLRTLATYRQAQQFRADVLVSFGNPTVGLPAWLRGKPYLAVTDTEHAKEQHVLFKPFATRIATPEVFTVDFGPRQVRYPSYHELAYLHPEQFTPDIRVLEPYGVQPGTPFFVVRFVAWRATHDVGQHGFSLEHKRQMLRELAQQGQVFLSVEETVDPEFTPYVTQFPPEIIHHLLAFARLYVGEGGTMASESAVLGTPAIFVNTLTMGYIQDLQHTYGLLFQHTDGAAALAAVRDVLQLPPETFAQRRQQLLRDKINPTPWLASQIKELAGI